MIFTLLISALSFVFSMYSLFKNDAKQNYLEQDKQYSDLLKLALNDPELREQRTINQKTRAGDKKFVTRYNIYAYLMWNCLETFYDLSSKEGLFHKNKSKIIDQTWIPVIIEENKIHYNWFKQNQRLFKEEFQNYINQLNDVVIRQGTIAELDSIYESMLPLFPPDEVKEKKTIRELMHKKKYILYIAENPLLSGQDKVIGFCFIYLLQEYKTIWLDYMAINPTYQSMGYGTLLFNNIASTAGDGNYSIFAELDIPENENPDTKENRRLKFYKQQGMKILDINYHLPTKNGSLPMYLAYKAGNASFFLSDEYLTSVLKEVVSNIHSDLESMPKVLNQVTKNLKDLKI